MDQENQTTSGLKEKSIFVQLALPISILAAALIISGVLFYIKSSPQGGEANIAGKKQDNVTLKISNNDHLLGENNTKATVIVFADFRCSYCNKFHQQVEPQIIKDYVDTGKVRFIFKNYAFLGEGSILAAQAAECAADQDKYWEYYKWLFESQSSDANFYSKENFVKFSTQFGMNKTQFSQCLESGKYANKVTEDQANGMEIGITGTPVTLIVRGNDYSFDANYIQSQLKLNKSSVALPNGNSFIIGAQSYSVFKAAIDRALE